MSLLHLIPFTLSAWLGFFLLGRGSHPRLRLTGLGLLFYAAALEINNISLGLALRVLPPVFWVGAILYLDQRIVDRHPILFGLWKWLLLPVTFLLGAFSFFEPAAATTPPLTWISFLLGLMPFVWTLILIQDFFGLLQPRQVTGLLFAATIFFALGEAFLLFPSTWLPPEFAFPAIGIDLLFLGFCIAWFAVYANLARVLASAMLIFANFVPFMTAGKGQLRSSQMLRWCLRSFSMWVCADWPGEWQGDNQPRKASSCQLCLERRDGLPSRKPRFDLVPKGNIPFSVLPA